jgi:hypothetical protein
VEVEVITESGETLSSVAKASFHLSPLDDEETTGDGQKTVVSKQAVADCDGSGHGYYVITYSDGTVEYQDY